MLVELQRSITLNLRENNMFPLAKLFYVTPAPLPNDYDRFIEQKDSDILAGLAIETLPSGTTNNSPYWTNNNIPIRVYSNTYTDVSTWSMSGSPYGKQVWGTSHFYRILQHAFPTQALFDYNFGNQKYCMLEYQTLNLGSVTYESVARNGYTSQARTISSNTVRVTTFVYYDDTEQRMMKYNPYTMSTPEYYYTD